MSSVSNLFIFVYFYLLFFIYLFAFIYLYLIIYLYLFLLFFFSQDVHSTLINFYISIYFHLFILIYFYSFLFIFIIIIFQDVHSTLTETHEHAHRMGVRVRRSAPPSTLHLHPSSQHNLHLRGTRELLGPPPQEEPFGAILAPTPPPVSPARPTLCYLCHRPYKPPLLYG